LKELDISGHKFGYRGTIALSMGIELNSTLEVLQWDDNEPTVEGLKRFLLTVQNNSYLYSSPFPILNYNNTIENNDENGPIYYYFNNIHLNIHQSVDNKIEKCIKKEIKKSKKILKKLK